MGKASGYDFGVKCFMTDNDGRNIHEPEFYKCSLGELRKKQRALSRKEDGSNNRKRPLRDLERTHRKVANQRKDWLNKLSLELASGNATICIEDLNIKAWQRIWGRKVSDHGISACIRSLENACAKTGSTLVKGGGSRPLRPAMTVALSITSCSSKTGSGLARSAVNSTIAAPTPQKYPG